MRKLYHQCFIFVVIAVICFVALFKLWGNTRTRQNHIHSERAGASFYNATFSAVLEIEGYVHPFNSSIAGKDFNLQGKEMETVKQLIADLTQSFKTRPVKMDSVQSLPELQPVTAISSNHFIELMAHIRSVEKILPRTGKIIVYDLGLNPLEIDKLNNMTMVEYRRFNFSRFPKHVRNLKTYAFKPLIIQEILAQYSAVLWMDSSVIFTRHYSYLMERMISHKSGFLFYLPLCPIRHSIIFATHAKMFEYLPMGGRKEMTANMAQATGMIVFNTADVLTHIMKWAIVCTLHKDCIAPSGAILACDFSMPDDAFGGCHRYDQSLFGILVSNAYNGQTEKYRLSSDYLATVEKM